jgi:branched-chain amino acid transport system permease protein
VSSENQVMTIAIQTFILAALASSWNILGGFAGQISLGHAAFFGIGAIVTRELWLAGSPLPLALLAAVVGTAVIALVIGVPMLRFRGIYFSIGTLALAVAIGLTIANLFPGITSMPVEALRSYSFTGPYYLALGAAVTAVVVAMLLKRSVVGLGMTAVRDDEEAAAAVGVDVLAHKLSAFSISAALAALAGGAFAYFSVSYYPSFPFTAVWSFETILVVFVGGIGTIVGPLLGSAFFVIGRDTLAGSFEGFQVIAFGVLFIVVVLLVPGGMVEGVQRIRAWVVKQVKREDHA